MEVVGSVFTKPGQEGDFAWMAEQPEYAKALFIFNDNEEQYLAFMNHMPYGFLASGGNAVIRPLRGEWPPRAVGIPTGTRKNGGYKSLNFQVRNMINAAFTHVDLIVEAGWYDQIIYSDDGSGDLGTGIFKVDKKVKDYIIKKLMVYSDNG